ncbi:glycerophosphodiester phosphodiesterase [Nocardioides jishulii]|uniref:Glycerophosphodiester phosphodiesterase n=1 Tax=Nocardioides jishulii TaxID=2575440 RepID=A0A4U2YNF9_9ACTN|nr:glycerophosphodiester phosphodiesterase [Nocardioides jishulii]QCX27567.1 glycerophosphodiester phosphodiesterase [Nocardioides jishulii]TKI62374.1 glycerophosphodiester phosphodiesterase [Nocardioides jishulii]
MIGRDTGYAYLDDGRPVLAFAHRGGALHPDIPGLENTAVAFAHAVALGYTYLETDVHVTSDGVVLAFHDDVLDRVTDRVGPVNAHTHAEVSEARIGAHGRIPTLRELLDAFPGARFNIDIKARDAVEPLMALIDECDAWDRVLVGSFSGRRLNAFRALARGRVATSAHPLEVAAFRLLPSGRLARWVTRGQVAALQVPHHRGWIRVVTPGFVRRAHAAGAHVHVWTIDDPEEMEELLDRGVDGLVTDRTDILKEVLLRRGLWREHA